MKTLMNLAKFIFISILIIFLHYAISYLLPAPWNHVNIIILASVVFIIGWESGIAIWLACLLSFFVELYSVSPFGLILLPGTFSIMLAYWLYVFIFTNRSWWSAAALTAITIMFYRVLYTFIFVVVEYFSYGFNISWRALFIPYFWELALTSLLAGFVIFIFSKFWRRFNMEKSIL